MIYLLWALMIVIAASVFTVAHVVQGHKWARWGYVGVLIVAAVSAFWLPPVDVTWFA